ncbi:MULTISPECIES: alpha/beta fold hydrolase [unclassified Gordonia (in: high G+C Gram-positive bacteria)]
MIEVDRPKIEGSIAVEDGRGGHRRIGFAEYGCPSGRPFVWLHGTPGARRQIPTEARRHAETCGIRLIGLDRPGVGSSTAHRYQRVYDFVDDLTQVVDALGVNEFAVIGVSGGGPYALATAHALGPRVCAAGVVGGVAPTVGPEAIAGGVVGVTRHLAPLVSVAGAPVGRTISTALRFARPIAEPCIMLYGRFSPVADRELLARPEFRAMFLDDLLNGGSHRMEAPFTDVVVFARDWGFRAADVSTPVRWWHGDHDHIVPFAHGEHVVSLLPDAKLFTLHGESHLSPFGMATEVLDELLAVWQQGRVAGVEQRGPQ